MMRILIFLLVPFILFGQTYIYNVPCTDNAASTVVTNNGTAGTWVSNPNTNTLYLSNNGGSFALDANGDYIRSAENINLTEFYISFQMTLIRASAIDYEMHLYINSDGTIATANNEILIFRNVSGDEWMIRFKNSVSTQSTKLSTGITGDATTNHLYLFYINTVTFAFDMWIDGVAVTFGAWDVAPSGTITMNQGKVYFSGTDAYESDGIVQNIKMWQPTSNYYVDQVQGLDAYDGRSIYAPWKTIAKVNGATFAANDSIFLRTGCTWREQLIVPHDSLYFGSYDSTGQSLAKPIIDASNLINPGSSWTAAVSIDSAEKQISYSTVVPTNGTDTFLEAQGISSTTAITIPYIDLFIKKNGSPVGYIWIDLWLTTGTPKIPAGASAIAATNGLDASAISTTAAWVRFTFASPPTLTADSVYYITLNASYTPADANCIQWGVYTSDNYKGDNPYRRCLVSNATPPVIQGGWNQDMEFVIFKTTTSTTIWTAAATTEPKIVFFDGTKGTLVASQAACTAEGNWFWAANILSVYSTTDPDMAYTSPGIEVGTRDQAMTVWTVNYLTFKNLHFRRGNGGNALGIILHNGYGITYDGCEISYGYRDGINLITTSKNNIIKNCSIHDNHVGIYTYQDASDVNNKSYVQNCTVYNNAKWGIYIRSNYWIVEYNTVYNNGSLIMTQCIGINICDLGNAGYAQHCIARYNHVYGTLDAGDDGTGIMADEFAMYVDIYYNVIHGNSGPGLAAYKANNINFYNNSLYGNCQDNADALTTKTEIKLMSVDGNDASNIVVKNNVVQSTKVNTYAIYVDPWVYVASGLNITNNDWYTSATNWYYWNSTGGNNLATWNALTGVGTDLNSDPLFISSSNFNLLKTSPCIDAGVNVSLTTDYMGLPVPKNKGVDIGAYEYQASLGKQIGFPHFKKFNNWLEK